MSVPPHNSWSRQPPAPIVAVLKVFAKYFPSLRIPTIFQGGLKKSQAIWKEEVLIEVGMEQICCTLFHSDFFTCFFLRVSYR